MNSLRTPETYRTREEFAETLLDYINIQLPIVHPKAAGHEPFERSTPLFEVGGIDSLLRKLPDGSHERLPYVAPA